MKGSVRWSFNAAGRFEIHVPLNKMTETGVSPKTMLRTPLLLPAIFAAVLLASGIIVVGGLDQSVSDVFHSRADGWYLAEKPPWIWLYNYGTIPGLLLSLFALGMVVHGLASNRRRELTRLYLVVVLTTIIGPGIIVNGLLKSYWGRPRPRHVLEYGGQWTYRHFFQPGIPGKGASFPCGHCSMGFVFCTLAVFRRRNKHAALAGLFFGLLLGGLLGAARIVQGAHFLSDVLWSMGIVLMTAAALYQWLPALPTSWTGARFLKNRRRKWFYGLGFLLPALGMLYLFSLHRPFFEEHRFAVALLPETKRIVIRCNRTVDGFRVHYQDVSAPRLTMVARGFGSSSAKHRLNLKQKHSEGDLIIDAAVRVKGYMAEIRHDFILVLPRGLADRIETTLIDAAASPETMP